VCNFLSVLVLRNGHVLHHPMLDSHSDLVNYFNLPDEAAYIERFAKAELTPSADTWLTPDAWHWHIDEAMRPAWLDDVEAQAEKATRAIAARMVLTDGRPVPKLIIDGCWIVGGSVIVRDVRGGRIVRVQDSAQIRDVWGNAQIHGVWNSAQIRDVMDSAQIHGVWNSAQIRDVMDSAQIHDVWGSAQIHDVGDNAQIRDVMGSAQIHDVRGSAQIRDVWGNAQIRDVWGNAILDDSARAHVIR